MKWILFVSAVVAGTASLACSSPTEPTGTATAAPDSNVSSAPRGGAYTFTASDVSLEYWFNIAPRSNTTLARSSTWAVTVNCRRSQTIDAILWAYVDVLDENGAGVAAGSNRGVNLTRCEPGGEFMVTGDFIYGPAPYGIPQAFTVASLRIRMYLQPAGATLRYGEPDAVHLMPTNWRVQ